MRFAALVLLCACDFDVTIPGTGSPSTSSSSTSTATATATGTPTTGSSTGSSTVTLPTTPAPTESACTNAGDPPAPILGAKVSATSAGTTQSVFYGAVQEIQFDIDIGSIDVVVGTGKDVVVTEVIRADSKSYPQTSVTESGGVLTIVSVCPADPCNASEYDVEVPVALDSVVGRMELGGVSVVDAVTDDFNVDAVVGPVELRGSVDIVRAHAGSGVVTASIEGGVQAALTTEGGNIEVEGAEVRDELCTATGAGLISIVDAAADVIVAQGGIGDVSVHAMERPTSIDALAEVGDIAVEVPTGDYAVDVSTWTLGTVTLTGIHDDPKATSSISAHTELGDVTVTGS